MCFSVTASFCVPLVLGVVVLSGGMLGCGHACGWWLCGGVLRDQLYGISPGGWYHWLSPMFSFPPAVRCMSLRVTGSWSAIVSR